MEWIESGQGLLIASTGMLERRYDLQLAPGPANEDLAAAEAVTTVVVAVVVTEATGVLLAHLQMRAVFSLDLAFSIARICS